MFSFKVDIVDFGKIVPFLGSYLDIIYKDRSVILCSEGSQTYVQCMCPAVGYGETGKVNVRLDTSLFCNMVTEGKVEVEVIDTEVVYSFYTQSDSLLYKTTVPRQVSYIDLEHKSNLFSRARDSKSYDIAGYNSLIRLCSRLKTTFVSNEGFCYSYYNKNYIFKKSELPTFCVDSELLGKCLNVSSTFTPVGDYLMFKESSVAVILQKQKVPLVCDIPYIVKTKARRHVKCNLSNLTALLMRIKLKQEFNIKLNLDASLCMITSDNNRFEVPVEVLEDSKKSADLESLISNLSNGLDSVPSEKNDSTLSLPYWFIKVTSRVTNVDLFLTSRFTILKFNGINVTIGGSS